MKELDLGKLPATEKSRKEPISLQVPGYSIPIFIALSATFPKETSKTGFVEVWNRIDTTSPLMVAANEVADVGMRASDRLYECRQDQKYPLIRLENDLYVEKTMRLANLETKYPAETKNTRLLVSDFLLLSSERHKFSENEDGISEKYYLEIDSGIIETIYTSVALPSVLEKAGVNITALAENADDLMEKYQMFVFDGSRDGFNSYQLKLRALHAAIMIMKIDDDIEGINIDSLLGNHNFTVWAEENFLEDGRNAKDVLNGLKEQYCQEAEKGGYPKLVTKIVCAANHFKGLLRDSKAVKEIVATDDFNKIGGFINNGGFPTGSTTFRRELGALGLDNLFNNWPKVISEIG